jgi:hypothetical protein
MSLPFKELSEQALDALIARERTRVVAPLTEWHTLSAQLKAEGLLGHDGAFSEQSFKSDFRALPVARNRFVQWGTRFVAGAALLGAGVVVGRGLTLGEEIAPAIRGAIAQSSDTATTFSSPKRAREVLQRSQMQYQRASAYLAAHDTSAPIVGGAKMYRERLAALDEVMTAARAQLETVPGDPLLSQYYQSTVGAREATIQRLGEVLPVNARIAHY